MKVEPFLLIGQGDKRRKFSWTDDGQVLVEDWVVGAGPISHIGTAFSHREALAMLASALRRSWVTWSL